MICQVQRWKDLDRWVPGGNNDWECLHTLVPLDDLLTPTELVLRSLDAYEAALGDQIRLLARNAPPAVQCIVCSKPATVMEAGWNSLNLDHCFCAVCADSNIGNEGMRLPIVNSPRVGVCAYCG